MYRAMQRVIRNKGSHGVDGTYKPSPGRSQHQAIKQSLEYINQGYKWVVDMDLEKFFDKVNHDILIDRLCKKNRRIRIYEQIQEIFKSVWNLMNRCVPTGTHGGVRGR